jgi:predicted phosphoribosyltransferase
MEKIFKVLASYQFAIFVFGLFIGGLIVSWSLVQQLEALDKILVCK